MTYMWSCAYHVKRRSLGNDRVADVLQNNKHSFDEPLDETERSSDLPLHFLTFIEQFISLIHSLNNTFSSELLCVSCILSCFNISCELVIFTGQMTSFVGGSCRAAGVPRDQIASLFVGDLHPEVSEFVLHQMFSPFGPIQSVRVCRDRLTRRSLRYGYVNFVNLANAESAMDNLMCQDLLGRPMRIMFSQRDSTLRTTGVGNIFVKGLASSIDGARLHDSFSIFGKILSCKVVCDANGSKGYGFVHFATFEAAEKAIKALDGMLLDDQLVSIGHFKTFEERRVEPQVVAQDNERRYPVEKRPDAQPENQPALQDVSRQTAACALAQSESLRPPMPVDLWDDVNTRPPRLLVSQVLMEYWCLRFPKLCLTVQELLSKRKLNR
ncbi:uncharacterized protein LOC130417423 [Triplophysa dalaica]|uniref:uncharacterized protein LOC130417423 n=1 Tax=Triplophysa dalaica TaxID=1582913 RepID=UPI0024DF47E5|nr:uncharacterized protein LOC130417423 [Triplophysa dalaica]